MSFKSEQIERIGQTLIEIRVRKLRAIRGSTLMLFIVDRIEVTRSAAKIVLATYSQNCKNNKN